MIKINKNYKEFKAGVKPVYEEPKRIYYRVDNKYREAFTIFESKVLFNLDISKRKMHDQEKKTRLIVSEISKLKSRLTGFDQYDNPVKLAEPQELAELYYDIKIKDLKLVVALVEGVVRTRQYTEQYVDILYKRVVLRGLRSLARLKDIALLYDKTGFQNHKVIRVEPLTTGAGTSRATKRLDERIDLVIKHDIDDAENDQVTKKILNYGGIYQPIICRMKPKNKSDVVHGKIINNNDIVWSPYANTTIFNMKILWNHNSITWSGWEHQVGLIHDGNITCKNIDFQISGGASSTYYNTPNYFNCSNNILGLSRVSGTPNIQNNVPLTYIEESILNLDLSFLPFIDLIQRNETIFDPHKQKYKPTYTLIPLASSGYYDISQNDLVDLGTEAKKNINLPVLNETRAMSNLTNFKITL